MAERLVDAVKGVVAVNLRYTSLLLNLTKEYVKAFEGAVREGVSAQTGPAAPVAPAAPAAAAGEPAGQPASRRTPILLAGELGDEASGAFALANTSDKELNVNLVMQGEFDAAEVQINPSSLVLAPGANATIRLKLALTSALEEGRDYFGAVLAPGLSTQAIEFVVRRLPASAPAGKKAARD
jgi:hypothetical protein